MNECNFFHGLTFVKKTKQDRTDTYKALKDFYLSLNISNLLKINHNEAFV